MTDSSSACPTTDQIKSLVDGSLPEADHERIQSHVDECAVCQQVLESLVQGSESWDSALDHLRHQPAVNRETVLSDAMKQMKAEEFVESSQQEYGSRKPLDFLSPSDEPGSIGKLGIYEVTDVVGQGGMGIVLKAFDPALHRVVAVKVLAPYLAHNPQARKRFVREAKAIAAVSHDHVITIYAIDESAEQPKIVMQYVSGRSLQQKIDQEGSLDLKEILRIGMQTAAGLAAAHAQGLVHRDVKPSNILLENGIQRVKLTDFGLARAVDDASLTQSGAIAGTPQYMAPEQANGDAVDYRADLFSLGSVMYAMCVGHSPFRASTTMGVLKRVCHDSPRPIQELNTDIPDWLCAIVMKLLSKDPQDRYQSAKSVADLLEKWLAHVQQPTVVARPGMPSGHSASSSIRGSSVAKNDLLNKVAERLDGSARRQLDARTIFFQPISGRWLLFFFLLGMAGTIAAARMGSQGIGQPNKFELIVISMMGGFFTACWGLLIIAVGRFLWANLYGYIPWVAKSQVATGSSDSHQDLVSQQSQKFYGLWPEQAAILSGIVAMFFSFNPMIAAIIAILVWRALIWKSEQRPLAARTHADSGLYESPPVDVADASLDQHPVHGEPVGGISALLGHLGSLTQKIYSQCTWDRCRLPMAIGWFLVGGVDLVIASMAPKSVVLLIWFVFVLMSILSFTMSYCIQARQNFEFTKWVSYLGLLPITIGALGRIPLSIITLFWLNSPGTRESFSPAPFLETLPGRFVRGSSTFLRRMLGTAGLSFLWTLGWLTFVAGVFWLIVLPYGPSAYDVYDKSRVTLKDQPENQFVLICRGWGSGSGLIPPSTQSFEPREILVEINKPSGSRQLNILLGGPNPINRSAHQWLTAEEVETFLSGLDGQSHHDESLDLFEVIERLNNRSPESAGLPMSYAERMRISVEMWRRHFLSNGPPLSDVWPGFLPLSIRLNPRLFDIRLDNDLSRFDCYPANWFLTVSIALAVLVWLFVNVMIIRHRHFPRTRAIPAAMAVAV